MQWINLAPEDAGIQNLRRDTRRPAVRRDVDAVSPYPSARPPRIDEDMRDATGKHRERRAGDRRAGTDRRKEQIPILLDTRCKHDRRAIGNRRSPPRDTDTRHSSHNTQLNLYA